MVEPKFHEGGIYKIVLTNGKRFTGYCRNVGKKIFKGMGRLYTIDIGETSTDTTDTEEILIISDEDIKSVQEMSPRYVDTVELKGGKLRYKAHFKIGEE